MDFTICIPVFNYEVYNLISRLNNEIVLSGFQVEIIVLDDYSSLDSVKIANRKCKEFESVCLIESDENLGRSNSRNLLAKKAKSDNIIFLDADTFPVNDDFLGIYFQHLKTDKIVVGGISYRKLAPDSSMQLRWKYGNKVESKSAAIREKTPYKSFMTGNFAIKRSVLLEIEFEKTITKYGHEDTLFGILLHEKNIEIKHIDNPVYHDGIESNRVFIEKTEQAIDNLIFLSQNHKLGNQLEENTQLLKVYKKIIKWPFNKILAFVYKKYKVRLIRMLDKENPSLSIFKIYKITYLCFKKQNKQIVSGI